MLGEGRSPVCSNHRAGRPSKTENKNAGIRIIVSQRQNEPISSRHSHGVTATVASVLQRSLFSEGSDQREDKAKDERRKANHGIWLSGGKGRHFFSF